jgi:hypothetical protein
MGRHLDQQSRSNPEFGERGEKERIPVDFNGDVAWTDVLVVPGQVRRQGKRAGPLRWRPSSQVAVFVK